MLQLSTAESFADIEECIFSFLSFEHFWTEGKALLYVLGLVVHFFPLLFHCQALLGAGFGKLLLYILFGCPGAGLC